MFLTLNINEIQAQIPAPNLYCIKGDTVRWDIPTINCGAFQAYELYAAQNFSGPYSLLSTITDPNQTEFIYTNSPGGIIYYYMRSLASCAGQNSLTSDTLDSASPLPVNIQVVSVTGNDIDIFWTAGLSPETHAYIIYKGLGGGAVQPLDTVTTLNYSDTNKSTNDSSYTYYITALDRCGGTSVFSTPHATMLLTGAVDTCSQLISIDFTPYLGWPGNINYYVLVSENNGPEYIAGTTLLNNFIIDNLTDDVDYCIRIQANEPGQNGLSFSNQICLHSKINETISNLCITGFIQESGSNVIEDGNAILDLVTNDNIPLLNVVYQQTDNLSLFNNQNENPLNRISGQNSAVLDIENLKINYFKAISIDACGNRIASN